MKLSYATCLLGVSTSLVLFGCGSQTTLTMENAENAQSVTTVNDGSTCATLPDVYNPNNPPYVRLPGCDSGFTGTARTGPGRALTPEEEAASEAEAALNTELYDTVPPNAVYEDPFVATTTSSTTTTSTTTSPTTSTLPTTTTLASCVFSGFFSPVDNNPVVNVVKAGAAVPVKFGFCQSGTLTIFSSGSPASSPHACGTQATDDIELTVAVSTSGLTFDPASSRYQYNWKTEKEWAGQCRTLSLVFTNGSTRTAEFRFR